MATADEYAAWIVANADKKGTPEFATVEAAYRDSRSIGSRHVNDFSAGAPSNDDIGAFKNIGLGALNTAANIGSTLMSPIRRPLNAALESVGLQPTSRDENNKFFAEYGNPGSGAFKTGGVLAGIAGTAGAGGLIAKGVRSVPALANSAPNLAAAIESGGFSLGAAPIATTGVQLATNFATRLAGGAVAGGASAGLINPDDTGTGMAIGAAIPVVGRAVMGLGKGAKAAIIDPIVNKDQLIASALRRAVGGDNAAQVAAAMDRLPSTEGVRYSAGQASGNPALNAMEDSFRTSNPGGPLNALAQSNRSALAQPIRDLAQDDVARAAAVSLRDDEAQSLYGRAFQSDAMRRDLENAAAAARYPFVGRGVGLPELPRDLPTPGLTALAKRPAFKAALQDATTSMQNSGNFSTPVLSLEGLHRAKLAIDATLNGSAPESALARFDKDSLRGIKESLVKEMESIAPLYGNARKAYADMSVDANRMDVGQLLLNKLLPATSGDIPGSINAASYARALQNPDQVAKLATGFKKAELDKILSPEQLSAVMGVNSDASRLAEMYKLGAGGGSATARRQAMRSFISDNFAEQMPGANLLAEVISGIPGGNYLSRGAKGVGNMFSKSMNEDMAQQLETMLANDPQAVADALLKSIKQKGASSGINPTTAQLLRTLPTALAAQNNSNNALSRNGGK